MDEKHVKMAMSSDRPRGLLHVIKYISSRGYRRALIVRAIRGRVREMRATGRPVSELKVEARGLSLAERRMALRPGDGTYTR